MLAEIEAEIGCIDVLASDLSVSEVWAFASPIFSLFAHKVVTVAQLRFDSVSVLV
jgi:hypothetical protein